VVHIQQINYVKLNDFGAFPQIYESFKRMNLEQISEWFQNLNIFNDNFPDTRIPSALINDENKLFEENIEAKLKEIESIQINIDEHYDRIQMLEDHHKIVQDEIDIIQRLLTARRTEETTEQSHTNIDISEVRRMEKLTEILENDLIRFKKRKNHFEVIYI